MAMAFRTNGAVAMKLTDHCFAVTGLYFAPPWSVNAGFIVGEKKTLVIDSGSNTVSAQTIYGYASLAKAGNELLLINTEKHLDHIGGNGYFASKGIKILGHASIERKEDELELLVHEINELLPDRARREHNEGAIAFRNTSIVNPDMKIEHDTELDLGGITVQVIFTPGHTPSNLSVCQRDAGIIYCGDCLLPEFIPNLEEGFVPDWQCWLESLEKIQNLKSDVVVPGHGNVLIGRTLIQNEIERTKTILSRALRDKKAPTGNE
jgi:glyoxylase-like metal-dependent hydrolase (beta-lactamase superfamily II)